MPVITARNYQGWRGASGSSGPGFTADAAPPNNFLSDMAPGDTTTGRISSTAIGTLIPAQFLFYQAQILVDAATSIDIVDFTAVGDASGSGSSSLTYLIQYRTGGSGAYTTLATGTLIAAVAPPSGSTASVRHNPSVTPFVADEVLITLALPGNGSTPSAGWTISNTDLGLHFGTGPCTPPSVPANLAAASCNGSGRLDLTWDASTGDPTIVYELGRTGAGTIYTGTARAFSDTGLVDGTEYQYQVRAVNECGTSAWSSPIVATPEIAPVASLTGSRECCDKEHLLTWGVSAGAAYRLYHVVGGVDILIYSGSALSFSYRLTASERGFAQTYRLYADNDCGTGGPSTVVVGPTFVPASACDPTFKPDAKPTTAYKPDAC